MNKPKTNRPSQATGTRIEIVEWLVDAPVRVEVHERRRVNRRLTFGSRRKDELVELFLRASGSIPV